MSSIRKRSDTADSSDDDDFFNHSTSPVRTQTRVVSTRRRSSENSNTYSDDDYDHESDVTVSPRRDKPRKSTRTVSISPYSYTSQRTSAKSQYSTDASVIELHSSVRKSHSVYGNIRRKTAMRESLNSRKVRHVPTKTRKTSVARLMLSSKQQEMNELLSRLTHARQKLSSVENENKLLKKLQDRQDKAIQKFEDTENDLPRLLSKNSEDQRTLKAKLRKSQETKRSLESKLAQNNEEMQKMETVLLRLKKLVCDKSLGKTSELSQQLVDTESSLQIAERKIESLNKKLETTVAKCTKQLNTERQKHRDTMNKLQEAHEKYTNADLELKEKERAVNVSNIYSMRKKKSPRALLPIASSTPKVDRPEIMQPKPVLAITPQTKDESEKRQDAGDAFFNTSPSLNRLHSDTSGSKSQKETKSIFLTADYDSSMTSPNNSFMTESHGSPSRTGRRKIQKQKVVEEENHFADDLKKTEEEIKKLQIEVRQKADLLAKLQQIDSKESDDFDIPKSSSPVFSSSKFTFDLKSDSTKSPLKSDATQNPHRCSKQSANANQPVKVEREMAFGGYAPSVGGLPFRKSPALKKKPIAVTKRSEEIDEPLFDLSSGKNNRKSDLLAQLFGNQDSVKATAAV